MCVCEREKGKVLGLYVRMNKHAVCARVSLSRGPGGIFVLFVLSSQQPSMTSSGLLVCIMCSKDLAQAAIL